MAARTVTVIPPTVDPHSHLSAVVPRKRRVAGYARVSTDSDEQFTSYEAQIDYYTRFIQSNPDWEFVEVYTDEGISGTNTKHREGFNSMVSDALAGYIDLIVTKSISRFARNTVDTLVTVRKLKEKGVEVFFEKENIYTLDSKGELLITIMSSLAQEESRSISENVTWGQRKRFADGKFSLPYKQFLGYEKGPDGLPKIVPEQAAIVRRIYTSFMQGKTACGIAKDLTADGIPTPSGRGVKWSPQSIWSILKNEKYKGSAILQKGFTVDFLTKVRKVNEGEVPQYYIEHSHEAIIQPEEWAAVQVEIERRKSLGKAYCGENSLASRLMCGDCGGIYGPKLIHSTDKYRRTVWYCNQKYDHDEPCRTPTLSEKVIHEKFLGAYNSLLEDRETLLEDCRVIQTALTDTSALEKERAELIQEIEAVQELAQKWVDAFTGAAQAQGQFDSTYQGYVTRYEAAKVRVEKIDAEIEKRTAQAYALSGFLFEVSERQAPLTEFSAQLWLATIQKAVVNRDKTITFHFTNGQEVTR